MLHELEVKLKDKHVWVITDETVLSVGLDEHGRPQFHDSVLERFPRYMQELVEKFVSEMRCNPNQHRKCVDVNVEHRTSCAEAQGLGKCNCDPMNVSYTPKVRRRITPKKKLVQQLEITIKEENQCVEFRFANWVFKFDLDRNGNPLFPESVKNELPPYMPEMVEKIVKRMRGDDGSFDLYLDPQHEPWCAEVKGTGECNCWPIFFNDNNQRTYIETLTCAVCGESTTGKLGSLSGGEQWTKGWVWKRGRRIRAYWFFTADDHYERQICDDCLKTFHGYTYDVFANTPDLKALERTNPKSD